MNKMPNIMELERLQIEIDALEKTNADLVSQVEELHDDLIKSIETLREIYTEMEGDIKNHHKDDELEWNNRICDFVAKYIDTE